MKKIPTPTMGEFLKKEYMEPLNLSAYRVAKEIDVPTSRIQDILHNRREITVDTSIRLGRLFGMSDRFFLNVQIDLDIRKAKEQSQQEYDKIKPIAVN